MTIGVRDSIRRTQLIKGTIEIRTIASIGKIEKRMIASIGKNDLRGIIGIGIIIDNHRGNTCRRRSRM
jgi:hypothetical protein